MIRSTIFNLTGKLNSNAAKCVVSSFVRSQSTASKDLLLVEVNDKTGYATVTMNRPPVNSLNLELLTAFSKTLDDLQNNKSRGLILTSVSC